MIKYIVFDFDGTIADTYPHVLKIVSGLKKMMPKILISMKLKMKGLKD